jgi:glycosyltransferase involved in cell wall biosynthesis
MKILCVIDSLGTGGAQRQLVNLAIGFKKRGNEVKILTFYYDSFYDSSLEDNKIEHISVKSRNPIYRLKLLKSTIKNYKIDAVLSFMVVPSFFCEIVGFPIRNWKLVVGERGSPGYNYPLKIKLLRYFHFFADHVVSNSYSKIEDTIKKSPFLVKENCHVIYNLINLEEWGFDNSKCNFNRKKILINIAASHHTLKNGIGLLKALNLLTVIEKEQISIVWYGNSLEPPYIDESINLEKKLIKEYHLEKIIQYYPATKNISKKYQEADVIGLFSFNEGLPNAICEGMACGKPIIASAVSDVPYLVEDGINGFLCDPNSIESIANALRKIINTTPEERIKMGRASRKKAEYLFEPESIIDKYLELLSR